jgi:hypothetical protein
MDCEPYSNVEMGILKDACSTGKCGDLNSIQKIVSTLNRPPVGLFSRLWHMNLKKVIKQAVKQYFAPIIWIWSKFGV